VVVNSFFTKKILKGYTAIHYTILNRKKKALQMLLEQGAAVNLQTSRGITVLHLACINGYFEIAKLLLSHGSDLEANDAEGYTPLHASAAYGRRLLGF
jgi:ankyrin repeat protein